MSDTQKDQATWTRVGVITLIVIVALLLAATLAAFVGEFAHVVGAACGDCLYRYQTLIGNLAGFAGVIGAAAVGFHGLQKQSRRNAAEARARDDRLRAMEARALAAALASEFAIAYALLSANFQAVRESNGYEGTMLILRIAGSPWLPVLGANLTRIGLLEMDPRDGEATRTGLCRAVIAARGHYHTAEVMIGRNLSSEVGTVTDDHRAEHLRLVKNSLDRACRWTKQLEMSLLAFSLGRPIMFTNPPKDAAEDADALPVD